MTAAIEALTPMREVHGLDRARFDGEIRPAGRPVVIRGLAAEWPAVAAGRRSAEAIVDYLKAEAPPTLVHAIVGEPAIGGRFLYDETMTRLNFTRGRTPLAPFLDRLVRDQAASDPFAIAVQSTTVRDLLPRFAAENRIDLVDDSVDARMWIGNRILVAIHADLMENVGVVVSGRRRFVLFPPDQVGNLYLGPMELTPAGTPVSLVDLTDPDFDRFPRFRDALAHAEVATLEPGDAIYMPYHWWHGVQSLDAVNLFINYWWNGHPAEYGTPQAALLHAFYTFRNLPEDKKAVWRDMFGHYVFGDPAMSADHIPAGARGVLGPPTPETVGRMRATLAELFKS